MIEQPLIPVRMLNEYVYCPRLAHLMWVQAEFAHNEFTTDGVIEARACRKSDCWPMIISGPSSPRPH